MSAENAQACVEAEGCGAVALVLACKPQGDMAAIREEAQVDIEARDALLDACFGDDRFRKTCERLREGRKPADGLALVAMMDGRLVGSVRLWHVTAGSCGPSLMLGPIAVDPAWQGFGIGSTLMRAALGRAQNRGHRSMILVGDPLYYARFGFSAEHMGGLDLPGPVERRRLLGRELVPGSLAGARGLVSAAGAFEACSAPRERSLRNAARSWRAWA